MNNRIVIDTSVFVSALIGADGPSRKLIRYCLLGQYQPLIGNTLFAEYEAVMGRKEIIDQCVLSQTEVVSLLEALMSVCEWINIYYLWRPNLRDEGDNHLIELAISGNAHYIATNNVKDFQGTELIFPHLSILKPEHLLRG
ncbi:putative toxin-antitoxin system toxin component, PIN family [Synechocystis sp. PCC 7338]|uniref:putative toxin-antitoxin system toxin component, PIN family n=1 Tax=Synechocystis sp. PCC 7338 TaxID=2732530 RepID=UPI001BAFFAE6|nr:putative toxin-antitoxin system toxin component, PIN family [Synechocystis sp. PCC 7338]QUS62592.1 putative toxin-antitoxin system toxin component, PIN family [Synechocystis sp. PCC 7338]